MDSLSGTLLYGLAKWLAYCGWCWVGLRWGNAASSEPQRVALGTAIAAGSLRWLLGLVFGVAIFFVFATTREHVWTQYLAVYTPVRFIEWSIIGALFFPRASALPLSRKLLWVIVGIIVSFAIDMTSPDMVEHSRFCIGRCLC